MGKENNWDSYNCVRTVVYILVVKMHRFLLRFPLRAKLKKNYNCLVHALVLLVIIYRNVEIT